MKIYKVGIQWKPTSPTIRYPVYEHIDIIIEFYQNDEWLSYVPDQSIQMADVQDINHQFVLATFDPPIEANRMRIRSGDTEFRHNILVNDRVVGQIDVNYGPGRNEDWFDLVAFPTLPLVIIGGTVVGLALLARRR